MRALCWRPSSSGWFSRDTLAALVGMLSLPIIAVAAEVVPLSIDATVRQAEAIVVGTVAGRQSRWGDASQRWMVTDYTFTVEDVMYESGQAGSIKRTIVLTYWGGTIGDETQGISDLRLPAVGERLLVMLRPGWNSRMEFSPVVGLNQGLFSVAPEQGNAQSGAASLRDAGGRPLAISAGGAVTRATTGAGGRGTVSLDQFRTWLAANIATIKGSQPAASSLGRPVDGRVMPVVGKTPLIASAGAAAGRLSLDAMAEPAIDSESAAVPVASGAGPLPEPLQTPITQRATGLEYVTIGPKPNLPIIVNNLPDSFAPWSPEDEYQMSKWNHYASGVFQVYTTPKGTFAWTDNVFDIDGWISSATLQSVYGSGWGSNTIGITFYRSVGGTVVEADIALNPAFSFTLNDEWVYDGGSAQGFRQVMLHELGHMLGLDHDFDAMSVMNYMPSEFRFFAMPYSDDAGGIRALYPGNAVARTDLGVYLYYASGFQSITDASYPSAATAGGSLTVNHYTVENVGTTTIATPTIQWYLTSARNFNSTYYYLDQTTYGPALPSFSFYTPSGVPRTFGVPSYVPSGYYYLAAYVPGESGTGQSAFPFNNNYGFSRSRIFVSVPPPLTPGLVSPAHNSTGVTQTPTLTWGASTGATSYDVYFGTSPSPSYYAGTAATNLAVGPLSGATKYYWRVVARGPGGSSATSGTFAFTTAATLAAPSLVSPANNATGTLRMPAVTWSRVIGATSYDLYFGTSPTPAFYAKTTNTGMKMGPFPGGTKYYWYVVARSGSISSAPSSTFAFTTTTGLNRADILLRHTQSGDVAGWIMNGTTLAQGGIIYAGLPAVWRIDGVGDLNGDGKSDIVFRNTQTGDVAAWLMNGLTLSTGSVIYAALPLVWQIEAMGDLNGDGKSDIVFRNTQTGDVSAWLMNGLTVATGAVVYRGLPAAWRIEGTGDFNGDGKADILFRHSQSGDVAGWLMDGLALAQGATFYYGLPSGWQIDAIGDLNGDGRADIVIRYTQTGDVGGWLMNGLTLAQGAIIYAALPQAWQIQGVGDLNGDSKADLVWRNNQTGDIASWLMNGLTLTNGVIFYSGLPAAWQFQGIGDLDGF